MSFDSFYSCSSILDQEIARILHQEIADQKPSFSSDHAAKRQHLEEAQVRRRWRVLR